MVPNLIVIFFLRYLLALLACQPNTVPRIDLLLSGDHPAVVRDMQKKEKLRLRSGSKFLGPKFWM